MVASQAEKERNFLTLYNLHFMCVWLLRAGLSPLAPFLERKFCINENKIRLFGALFQTQVKMLYVLKMCICLQRSLEKVC